MNEEIYIDIDEIAEAVKDKLKENISTFDDAIELNESLNREIYLGGIVDGVGLAVERRIRYWNEQDEKNNIPVESRKPIKIFIDSVGGYLLDTFTIIDAINLSKTPVYTIAVGATYSGGFLSFISGHKRFAYPHASFLFHEGGTKNEGTASQFEHYTEFYKRQLNMLKDIVLTRTNISEEEYKDIKRDDVWFSVEDGINKGFIDEVVGEFIR